MSSCLGDVVAALVDGELDHASREKAQRHLAHCLSCRAEVEAQRRVKSRLGIVGEPDPSDGLTARLLGLAPPGPDVVAVAPRLQERGVRPATARTAPGPRIQTSRPASRATVRSTAGPGADARRAGSRLQRRAGVGSALVVIGLGAVLALGSPSSQGPSTPVDPGSDTFVAEFVSTTSGTTTSGSPAGFERGGTRSPR